MKYYYEPNDAYFRKHLQKLVKAHGGEVGSHCRWLADRSGARSGTQKAVARKRFPKDIPLIAPIPRKEELKCIL